jgi:three-Cys-motif partner protein
MAIVEGSAIVAVRAANDKGHPFTVIHIGDVDPANVEATAAGLRALGTSAAIVTHTGPATNTVREVTEQLSPWGLHFAFLDPYNLGDLSFSIIVAFAPFRRADLLINICAMDLQRNLEQALTSGETHHFDIFAPGWRDAVDSRQPPHDLRRAIRLHWVECVRKLGFQAFSEDQFELVRGAGNQPLYWLAMAAKNSKASEFWEKIRHTDRQGELDLSSL